MTHGFRKPDRPFSEALADAQAALLQTDFMRADMGEVAFRVARAALPHSLHPAQMGDARLMFDWIIACNQSVLLRPHRRFEFLAWFAEAASPEQVAFVRQNASLTRIVSSAPVPMSAAA